MVDRGLRPDANWSHPCPWNDSARLFRSVISGLHASQPAASLTPTFLPTDLEYRAGACHAIAFIGDHDALSKFDKIASKTGVRHAFQVRIERDGGLRAGRTDFQAMLEAVPEGQKYDRREPQKSTDLAMLYFTSGTTGKAKQVLLEQEWTLGHTMSGEWYGLEPGQLFANMADLGWAKAAYSTFGCFNKGGTLFVQTPPPGAFQPSTVVDMLNKYPIRTLCCPPTMSALIFFIPWRISQ